MKIILFFILYSIYSLQAEANTHTDQCIKLVDNRLSKYNQYRFKNQCLQIKTSHQYQCLESILNNRRAISLVEFNACTLAATPDAYKSIKEVAEYYHHTMTSFHVSLAALVRNGHERECLMRAVHREGITPFTAYECFEGRGLSSLRTFAQIYLK